MLAKKQKIRPGDILGALTKDAGIDGKLIGKIKITPFSSYVAVDRGEASLIAGRLSRTKVKNRAVKVKLLK